MIKNKFVDSEVSINLAMGKIPLVTAKINGFDYLAVIDTGAYVKLMFPGNIGVKCKKGKGIINAGFLSDKNVMINKVFVDSLIIGTCEFLNVDSFASVMKSKKWTYLKKGKNGSLELNLQPEGYGSSFVILGANLFQDRVICIDQKSSRFLIHKKGVKMSDMNIKYFKSSKFISDEKLTKVYGFINGHKRKFVIDSGNTENGVLLVNEKIINDKSCNWNVCGISGHGNIRKINIQSNEYFKDGDVVIGHDFFKNRNVYIDFISRNLYVV